VSNHELMSSSGDAAYGGDGNESPAVLDPWQLLFRPFAAFLPDPHTARLAFATDPGFGWEQSSGQIIPDFQYSEASGAPETDAPAAQAVAARKKIGKAANSGMAELFVAALILGALLLSCFGPKRKDGGFTLPSLAAIRLFREEPKPASPAPVALSNADPQVNVWVDMHTALYYCPGADYYGQTHGGEYMPQVVALQSRFKPADRKGCELDIGVTPSLQAGQVENGPAAKQTAELK
jgi:hypothetical protein